MPVPHWQDQEPVIIFCQGELPPRTALAVVSEVVQSQNNRCLFLAEEDSEVQNAAIVAGFVAVEGEEGMAGGVEDS